MYIYPSSNYALLFHLYLLSSLPNRVFDSRQHRCCFNLIHAKIGLFVCGTLLFHQITIGVLWLINQKEFGNGHHSWTIILVIAMRVLQLPSVVLMYYSLWKQNPYFLIPVGVTQIMIGTLADIYSLLKIIADAEAVNAWWLPCKDSFQILNIIIPMFLYFCAVFVFLYALCRCHVYFLAKSAFELERDNARRHFEDLYGCNYNGSNEYIEGTTQF
uniref:Uncharacterized protein n=1 Tax=Rhabditophanes sp. KR3021 TaxID=114890 RepID=A0AC35U3Z7_9BILA